MDDRLERPSSFKSLLITLQNFASVNENGEDDQQSSPKYYLTEELDIYLRRHSGDRPVNFLECEDVVKGQNQDRERLYLAVI